jgi:hypothetical protein
LLRKDKNIIKIVRVSTKARGKCNVRVSSIRSIAIPNQITAKASILY